MLVSFQQQEHQMLHHYTVSGDVDCGWLLDARVSEGFLEIKVDRREKTGEYIYVWEKFWAPDVRLLYTITTIAVKTVNHPVSKHTKTGIARSSPPLGPQNLNTKSMDKLIKIGSQRSLRQFQHDGE